MPPCLKSLATKLLCFGQVLLSSPAGKTITRPEWVSRRTKRDNGPKTCILHHWVVKDSAHRSFRIE